MPTSTNPNSPTSSHDLEITLAQGRAMLAGGESEWKSLVTARRDGHPMPPEQLPIPEGAVPIPLIPIEDVALGQMSVKEAILRRRSRRSFSGEPLQPGELSFLLWATQGVCRGPDGAPLTKEGCMLRTIPSACTRNPFETYVLVRRVEGLAAGLYRYLPAAHSLCPLRDHDAVARQEETGRVWGRAWQLESAVTLLWTAIPYRMEWRYGRLAAKLIAQESGHLCQNLYIAAEALGLATTGVGIYQQAELDAFLGVNPEEEFVVYAAPVGRPAAG